MVLPFWYQLTRVVLEQKPLNECSVVFVTYLLDVAGGKVYMACRSLERARVTADEIKLSTGVDDSRLIVMHLDVSSLSSVRSFANSFKTSTDTSAITHIACTPSIV